jgi:drug/metabolite transporter (DMT)-like permease
MGELAAVGAVFCWSWTAMFFTIASRHFGSWAVNLYRLALGALFLFLTHLVLSGDFRIATYPMVMLSLSGIIGLFLGDLLLFQAFVWMGPRLTMLVYTVSPALTAVLAWGFLGETIGWMGLAGMAVTVSGVVWTLGEKRDDNSGKFHLPSVALTVVAALGQSAGLVLAKAALNTGVDSLYATLWRMIAAFGTAALFAALFKFARPRPGVLWKRGASGALVGGAVFGPFLGVWLSQVAIQHTATGIASTILSTTPIFLIPVAAIMDREKATLRAVLGAVVAVAGVAMLFFR